MGILLYRLAFVFVILSMGNSVVNALEKFKPIDLHWQNPLPSNLEEDGFAPSLFFNGAVYTDSLPSIPVKVERMAIDLPDYTHKFSISNENTQLCTDAEVEILEESGYAASDFAVYTDSEITRRVHYARFHIIPIRKVNGVFEKLVSFNLNYALQYKPSVKDQAIHKYPEQSVLAHGEWFRVCIEQDGIFRLEKKDLTDLGMNPAQIDKSTIQFYGNRAGMLPESNAEPVYTDLQEMAIWMSGDNSGTFGDNDYLLFFGQSPNIWKYNQEENFFDYHNHLYSKETCYFITYGQEKGQRISSASNLSQTPAITASTFHDYAHYEKDLVNLIGSGKEWFGELFDMTNSRTFDFSFPNIVQQPMQLKVFAAARSGSGSSFTIDVSGTSQSFNIAGVNMSNATGIFARHAIGNIRVAPQNDDVGVKLTYNRFSSGAQGWLNYITINAHRKLIKTESQMFFRNPDVVGTGNITQFILDGLEGNTKIWDVSDPMRVKQQVFNQTGKEARFTTPTDYLKEFVVFDDQQFAKPRLAGKVGHQNLHGRDLHDLIIIVPDLLWQEAERLANFRREFDGLSVSLVSPQQIYNEFSSGTPDISAIRNYVKMFYDRSSETGEYPQYLLLFGNGTYDNKNLLGYGGNLIPTFQTLQSLSPASSYTSDDFFGLLDENEGQDVQGAIDIGIGRLPVRTIDEARFVVDKLIRYNKRIDGLEPGTDDPRFAGVIPNYADWRNVIMLVADDEDGNIHFRQSEQIAKSLSVTHPVLNIEKSYLDAYEQTTLAGGSRYPEVNKAIKNRVNQGALLINYIGHGGTLGLAHERILTFDDILSWGNFYNLPVFMTATCEFSSFDQPDANELSAGVRIFLKPDGGAAALFTTTRLAYSHSNFSLNEAFMANAFIPMENGEMPRLGDLIRISKVQSSSVSTLKNFVLLGDPSMQMAYPKYKAVTTYVPDTIKALDRVTIKGEIHFPDGGQDPNYNGVIYPVLYDKNAVYQTQANDAGSSVAEFDLRNRVIFRGKASVKDGLFEFSFIVPRDISYSSGTGKISYYFDDGEQYDGCGYFDNFTISGTSSDYIPDEQGPQISLYLNNMNFVSGDKTGPNPILLAFIEDENGTNTTGQIGHDIVAFLNDDSSSPFILNKYYQTDMDSYQSGRVVYPFFNLEKGNYTLTLRAWDVHNNPGNSSIEFIVTSATGIEMTQLLNFPNPFDSKTQFSIQHNKPATELKVVIEVFSINGQLVKSIEENVYASGFNVPPIEWDGTDEGGSLLENGIYIFRALVSTSDGEQVQRTEKLMILR